MNEQEPRRKKRFPRKEPGRQTRLPEPLGLAGFTSPLSVLRGCTETSASGSVLTSSLIFTWCSRSPECTATCSPVSCQTGSSANYAPHPIGAPHLPPGP